MDVKKRTFHFVKKSIQRSRDIVREPHGQIGNQYRLRSDARERTKQFLKQTVELHGLPVPMSLAAANGGEIAP